ncbi:unnamed protein product [Anisakis simplex]|uniref:Lipoprotein n=1 Tax=Anisakis simplex TaxID=6269 RepID=A0A0M3J5L2_ANISI|nr:unnamed protein product [Anisakis simplex]
MLRSRLSWLLLLVAFSFVFWCLSNVDAAVYRMPLMKQTSRHVRMMRDGKWAEYRRQQQEMNKSAGVLVHSEKERMMRQLSKQIGPCKRNAKVEIDLQSTRVSIGMYSVAREGVCVRLVDIEHISVNR